MTRIEVWLVAAGCTLCSLLATGGTVVRISHGQTLLQAQQLVRKLSEAERASGVEVVLESGEYVLPEGGLNFDGRDSGVVWRGRQGVRISDGVRLSARDFRPSQSKRIPASVRGVLEADLSALPVRWWRDLEQEIRDPVPIPELFVDDRRMTLAQWPNGTNWAMIARFVDMGTRIAEGGVMQGIGNRWKDRKEELERIRGGTFGYADDRPSRWIGADEVWLCGYWCFDWYDAYSVLGALDVGKREITLKFPHKYGVRAGNPACGRRWKAVNLLEELDVPGEYCIDRKTRKMYLLPPTAMDADSRIVLALNPRSGMTICGASGLTFENLEFTEFKGHVFEVANATNLIVRSCRFHNLQKCAIVASGLSGGRIERCDFSELATGGISIDGGIRQTLERGNNVISDCLFSRCSTVARCSGVSVTLTGCGNTLSHCVISDTPHAGVKFHGNDLTMEYCVVSNVCYSSDDAAGYYEGRDPSCRGNVLLGNRWIDVGWPEGRATAAIYFDDGNSGEKVVGNYFRRCGHYQGESPFAAVFSHGGYSNVVEDCVFEDCPRALGHTFWPQDRWTAFLNSPLIQSRCRTVVDIAGDVYRRHYPDIANILLPEGETVRCNWAYGCRFVSCGETVKNKWILDSACRTISAPLDLSGHPSARAGLLHERKVQ